MPAGVVETNSPMLPCLWRPYKPPCGLSPPAHGAGTLGGNVGVGVGAPPYAPLRGEEQSRSSRGPFLGGPFPRGLSPVAPWTEGSAKGTRVTDIERVGVVGCGQMGSGIAEVCARAGLDVVVAETTGEALELGRTRLANSLGRAAERGKITEEERDTTLGRLAFTTDLGDLADRDLVIEAVIENEQVKTEIFQVLDQIVTRPDAVLASNTSSIPLVKLAVATSRPEQVIGIHFFNPAPVQKLVEIIPALTTGEETIKRAEAAVSGILGKHTIRAQDRSGFVVNALLIPYLLSAVRMFESGIASREDIDNGMEYGCAHPMGPLKLADLIGLDTVASVADSMYSEFKEPLYAAPPLLQRMVDAGRLGRKAGAGFYAYG
jgi:3-hydroxybutyryl-CoA dehydrogenase